MRISDWSSDVCSSDLRLLGFAGEGAAGRQLGDAGQPLFQLVEEAVVGLRRAELEKAEHQSAAEAEQGGAEGRAHAGQWGLQAAFQVLEQGNDIASAGREAANRLAHRVDRC